MKLQKLLLTLPIILSLAGCNNTSYEPKELDPAKTYDNVYLIMGQSNASGVSPFSYIESYEPDLYQRYMKGNAKVLITYDVDGRVNNDYVPTKFGFGCNEETFGEKVYGYGFPLFTSEFQRRSSGGTSFQNGIS